MVDAGDKGRAQHVGQQFRDNKKRGVPVYAMSLDAFQKFRDEQSALLFLQRRLWPRGSVCPRCGCPDRIGSLRGHSTQLGSYKCYNCRKVFTVKTGTFFESSHVPLHKWLQAIYLCGCEEIRPSYLGDVLGVSFKTAALMVDRIRFAASHSAFNGRSNASLVPEDRAGDGRLFDGAPAVLVDRACDCASRQKKPHVAQPDRFLAAANQRPQDNLEEKFETTFSRIVKSGLKLRAWRKDQQKKLQEDRRRWVG
jgi:transposase-like protein